MIDLANGEQLPRPIIIIGSARTGTSLTARLLVSQGVWCGQTRKARDKNPHGFYENARLHEFRRQSPADPNDVHAEMVRQGYAGGPWLVKHGLGGHEAWLSMDPFFVFPRRAVDPTVRSQLRWQPRTKTEFQRRQLFAKQQRHLDELRDTYGGFDFWPDRIVQGDAGGFRALVEWCGLTYDPDAAAAVVDPTIWGRDAG